MKKLTIALFCITLLCSCDYASVRYDVVEKARLYCQQNNSELYVIEIWEDSNLETSYDVSCSSRNVPTKRFTSKEI